MSLHINREHKSFQTVPTDEDLPPFMVITGANGSGKSQFLEALSLNAMQGDWNPGIAPVVLITAAQLGAPNLDASTGMTRQMIVDQLESHVNQYLRPNGAVRTEYQEHIYDVVTQNLGTSRAAILEAEERAGKRLKDWVHSDFERWTPVEVGQDLFAWSLSDTFQRYRWMRTTNDFNAWLASEGKQHGDWLPDAEFEAVHGPAPWDLLNDVLGQMGLPYEFVPPSVDLDMRTYVPRLRSETEGLELTADALSSGEKTLVQIALSVYSGLYRSAISKVPGVLLLDEPDSTLHPSMVRSMLLLIQDVLVTRLQMRVIITTHSPTTVALAPLSSIFVMERAGEPRLQRSTRDEALRRLLVGVPTVSVSAEHRRVIFTESPNDVWWYTKIFGLLRPHLSSERTLEFIAAGGKGRADGCDAVVDLVARLRDNGNVSVWGLVDRDNRTTEPNGWVIFNAERHSVENFVLDPLALGMLLLSDLNPGITESVPHSSFVQFRAEDAQDLADAVMAAVLSPDELAITRPVRYRDGTEVQAATTWLDQRGHDLQGNILRAFPPLNGPAAKGRLLEHIIDRVWVQYPGLIPESMAHTFLRLLDT